ncbi:MAG: 30S ribosomal protein S16 [bacterium]|nr:30S ribosomal protein S16 [bacterium]
MLIIRFLRIGKRNQPSFKIVVIDKRRAPRGGRFVEEVGFWNPLTKNKSLKAERIKYWISKGAKPSDTVYNLLISEKIIQAKKIDVHKKSKKKQEQPKEEIKPKKPAVDKSV